MPPDYTLNNKRCSKCGAQKDLREFNRASRNRDGLRSSCRECDSIAHKTYTQKHPERRKESRAAQSEYMKEWRKAHKEDIRQYNKAWRSKHPKYNRDKKRIWREGHREEHRAQARMCKHKRRAQKAGNGGTFTNAQIKKLYELQKGRCWWDAKHKLNKGYHIDHRVPLSKGGSNDISNIVLACPDCNMRKHDKMPSDFVGRLL